MSGTKGEWYVLEDGTTVVEDSGGGGGDIQICQTHTGPNPYPTTEQFQYAKQIADDHNYRMKRDHMLDEINRMGEEMGDYD